MKALFQKKTAGMLALLMTISLLLPVLAYASAWFGDITQSNGNVSGTVYVDSTTYGQLSNKDQIVIDVYGNDGQTVGQVYGTYSRSANGMVYYDFSVNRTTYQTYSALKFKYFYPGSSDPIVSTYVYRNVDNGGVVFIPTTPGKISVGKDGKVDATALKNALAANKSVTIEISGSVALLPASALTAGGTVTIVADGASYELPLDELNLEELAKELGVEIDGMTIAVTIAALTGDAKASAEAAVKTVDGEVIGGIFEFKIEAVAGDKKVEVKNFSKFIKRTIELTGKASNAVAVRITGNKVASVPTAVYATEAALYSKSNSVYTVINVEAKTFADLAGHWSQDEVEALASKLIVEGTGANKFEPKRAITRAEFAAMIVRALGLEANGSTDKFSDVSSSAWYAGAVAAAADAGIVQGDAAGTFRPSAVITRQELAAMVVRAMKVAGKEVKLTDAEVSAALAPFADAGKLGWAKAEVAAAVDAGIIEGQSATSVAPLANANRGEASAMVLRLLTNVGFIQ